MISDLMLIVRRDQFMKCVDCDNFSVECGLFLAYFDKKKNNAMKVMNMMCIA
jgi:hypothetical protein